MTAEFTLQIKPFSINSYHYRDKRHKTVEARIWEAQVNEQLAEVKELSAMAEDWKARGGCFSLYLEAVYPPFVYFTQTGEVSGRTIDVTNYEKPLQDLLFAQMGLNDKLVVRLVSIKSPGTYHYIKVRLELHPN